MNNCTTIKIQLASSLATTNSSAYIDRAPSQQCQQCSNKQCILQPGGQQLLLPAPAVGCFCPVSPLGSEPLADGQMHLPFVFTRPQPLSAQLNGVAILKTAGAPSLFTITLGSEQSGAPASFLVSRGNRSAQTPHTQPDNCIKAPLAAARACAPSTDDWCMSRCRKLRQCLHTYHGLPDRGAAWRAPSL